MISSTVHMLSDQDLREIKRQEWTKGFESALAHNSRSSDPAARIHIMDLTFPQIQFLARNYEIATGKPASEIKTETTKEPSVPETA